jgi:N-acetylglucosamine-6-sulfatase
MGQPSVLSAHAAPSGIPLTTGGGVSLSSYTTAPITPSPNALILLAVISRKSSNVPAAPIVSGSDLEWVQVVSKPNSSSTTRLTVFRAMGGSPSSGPVTIDYQGVQQVWVNWSIVQIDGVETSGANGENAIVQFALSSGTGAIGSVSLGSFESPTNATYGVFGQGGTDTYTPGSGFTGLAQHNAKGSIFSEFRADNDTSVDASWTTARNWSGIALEIESAQPSRPNIILILADDMRADMLAYMPNTLSVLTGRGVTFENAFHVQGLCCPARVSILTGLYPHNHGCFNNVDCAQRMKDTGLDQRTVATALDSTYWTGYFGKYLNNFDLLVPYIPPGWDVFDASKVLVVGDDMSLTLTDKAVEFIRNAPAEQPFFLFVGYVAPHAPARAPKADRLKFADIEPWNPPSFNEADMSDKPRDLQRQAPLLTDEEQANIQQFRKDQLASLQGVDRGIGRIVAELQALNEYDNTVIIFASDNGYLWGEHRLTAKNRVYEEVVRMPLIVSGPGALARTEAQLASVVDITATVADYAGAVMSDLHGESLRPWVEGGPGPMRSAVLLESGNHAGVRTLQYKYIEYNNGSRELYDLVADPYELESRHGDPNYVAIMDQLRAELAVLRAQ